ncbi:MAG: glycoside hydrolase family 15 protein [Bacillota bacterium]
MEMTQPVKHEKGERVENLDLAMIGNSTIAALLDVNGTIVWGCFPRFDGDALFCSLLRLRGGEQDFGYFAIDLADRARSEQRYEADTAIVITRLFDSRGGVVEIVDFCPRFYHYGRVFCPTVIVRQVRRLAGSPRITVRLRPADNYGKSRPEVTQGSNHIRYITDEFVLRATTDCPVSAVMEERSFMLRDTVSFVIGPDESLQGAVHEVCSQMREQTSQYWHEWVRGLSIPFQWQEEIIRAAITLHMAVYQDTGAIVAAVTTSLPEATTGGRTWDYRFCWLRDAFFVVNALNRLNTTRTMERYIDYIINISTSTETDHLQPLYRLYGAPDTVESIIDTLPGYRGIGPVRIGNQAYEQIQHDVYGSAVLAATHVFFDRRMVGKANQSLFHELEPLGEKALRYWDKPDAGLWELRGSQRVHTYSSVMCWVAADRLAKIAVRLNLRDDAARWRESADKMRAAILEAGWNEKKKSFVSTFGGEQLDASLLLLNELHFLEKDDPRFASTVAAIERELKRGDFVFRYIEEDDFGAPENAFIVCSFWLVDAMAALGRRDEALALFERLLSLRNPHGMLAEHCDPKTGELWGNFPQTYSHVGMINSAMRLSIDWDQAY